ncbi:MAG: hypothetical protein WDO69_05960 [Pseudomonadota bacterium]
MSARPPARSPEPEHLSGEPEELDDLEELGDEAIIAQQTAAHAPQPRANVSEESRSVVITEHPRRSDTEPPRNPPPRSSAEATLVIRDRRALDEMRQKIVRRQQRQKAQGHQALYLWGALGLAAFVLGGIVALLATDTRPASQTAENQPPAARGEAQVPLPSTPVVKPAATGSTASPPRAVRLDDLPVEHKH